MSGVPTAPHPAGSLTVRLATTDPGTGNPASVMPELPGGPTVAERTATTPGAPTAVTLTGLTPSTKYWWTPCFNPSSGSPDCAPVRTFVTAAAPVVQQPPPTPSPTGGTTQPPTAPPSPPVGPTIRPSAGADRTKPTARLKVTRVGRRTRLTVTATDASGIRSVTIKAGTTRAKTTRTLTLRIRRPTKILVTVTDRAGNVTTLRRTLRPAAT